MDAFCDFHPNSPTTTTGIMKSRLFSLLAVLGLFVFAGFAAADGPETKKAPEASAPEVATWEVDKSHSQVGFKVRHLGLSYVDGEFTDYEATIRFDPADLSTFEAEATIPVASITTGNDRRDGHLRSPDFFAAEEHPVMTFKSKEVRNIDGNTFEVVGDLTIRGTTKEVVLDAELMGTATMGDNTIAALEAETTINRLDYGLAWNNLTEAGGVVVGHDVTISLQIEAQKQQADAQ